MQGGHVRLIDTFLTEIHSSPWRQAVDLANMMLVLALGASPERVYQRALRQFTVDDIGGAFAVRQGRAMPSQVRELLSGRAGDLHAEFVRLLPTPPVPIRTQRWTARRIGLGAAIVLLLVLGALNPTVLFSNGLAVKTPLNVTNLGCTHLEPLWLMAQSVPSASQVPCMQLLPAGWSIAEVTVNNGRSVITLAHDPYGSEAVMVELTASCDLAGATEVTSEQPGARRYTRIDRNARGLWATRVYVFPGGCITEQLTARLSNGQQLTTETSSAIGFTTREELRQALSRSSGGRLHLDPGTAP